MEGTVRVAVVGVLPFQEEHLLVAVLLDIHDVSYPLGTGEDTVHIEDILLVDILDSRDVLVVLHIRVAFLDVAGNHLRQDDLAVDNLSFGLVEDIQVDQGSRRDIQAAEPFLAAFPAARVGCILPVDRLVTDQAEVVDLACRLGFASLTDVDPD